MTIRKAIVVIAFPVALIAAAVLATGAASSNAKVGTGSAGVGKCGLGTGKKAKGAPIKIDGLDMLIPGVDFTTVGKVAKAYFDCVNDNGGIHGRPVKYTLYNEQLNPAQEAALARKMVQSDKAVGIVGNTSFAECGTNWKYYKSKGYVVLGAGVQAECYSTPAFAEVNMGPRYSNIGAAQALIASGVKKIAIASPDTISAYADSGVAQLGKVKGVAVKIYPTHLPVTDASSQVLSMYQFAGQRWRDHPRLHPRHRSGVHEGRGQPRHRAEGEVGLVDADREHAHGLAVPAVRREPVDQPGGREPQPVGRSRHGADVPDPEEVRVERSRRRRSRSSASSTRRWPRTPCSTSRARSRRSRTTSRCGA